jgi:ABC-type phosphate transport system substrate-binding protein
MRVSLPVAAEGGRIRIVLAMLGAMALIAVAAASAPSAAHAAFTIEKCKGAPVEGQGSSAQKEAQLELWSTTIWHGPSGCGGSAPAVKYAPEGSGCGIASIGGEASKSNCFGFEAKESGAGLRPGPTRFGGSDAPLTETQKTNADAAGSVHAGVIHQIPVAAFAVTIVVHFPDGCKLKEPGTGKAENGKGSLNDDTSTGGPNDPPGGETGDTYAKETLRVHITDEELEKIWDGQPQEWKNIVPEADMEVDAKATKNTVLNVSECGKMPVIRIVRFDGSGTTYNFKAFLGLLEATQGTSGLWTTAPIAGDNTKWPETFDGTPAEPPVVGSSKECAPSEFPNHICRAFEKGGGEVAVAVQKTNGSIGYVDLATARKKGFYMKEEADQHTYWVPVQTVSPEENNKISESYIEPTKTPGSNLSASSEGANCLGADYRGYPSASASEPDPTLGDWEKAIATGGSKKALAEEPLATYPVCGLTYDFAWDDNAPVYGEGGQEQAKARTVKDYLEAVESQEGQYQLVLRDYGTLPPNIIQIAQNGVKAIDWKKEAGSGGKTEEKTVTPPPATTTTTTPITTTIAPPIPSNAFSVSTAKVKGKDIVLSLVLPDAGEVQVKASGGGMTVANLSASVSGGKGTVTLAISKAALAKLAKAKGHKLKVKITVTFTPAGGTAASASKTLTLTQAELSAKKKASKHKKKK